MKLKEILLDEISENEKRKYIEENLNREVIINDRYNAWNHGIISKYEEKGSCYKLQMKDQNKEKKFCYNNLKQLLVVY